MSSSRPFGLCVDRTSIQAWTPVRRWPGTDHGKAFSKIGEHKIVATFADYGTARDWYSVKTTVGELLAGPLAGFERGPKDGPTLCQAEFQYITWRRGSSALRNHYMLIDSDTGSPMVSVGARLKELGYAAVLWHSPSSGKTESAVPVAALEKHVAANEHLKALGLGARAVDYFLTVKDYDRSVFEGLTDVAPREEVEVTEDVVVAKDGTRSKIKKETPRIVITHRPQERFRILVFLSQPFEFWSPGRKPWQEPDAFFRDQEAKWKFFYEAFCKTIGVAFDPSCTDVVRHQFLPRTPKLKDHRIEVIDGILVDAAPYLSFYGVRRKSKPTFRATRDKGNGAGNAAVFQTPGLKAWLAKNADGFEIEDFFEFHGLRRYRASTTGTTFECPNAENHTDGGRKAGGFWAQNASEREGGFGCACSHATCKAAATAETGKVDRAWFLDVFMSAHGLGVEALSEFVMGGVSGNE